MVTGSRVYNHIIYSHRSTDTGWVTLGAQISFLLGVNSHVNYQDLLLGEGL